MPAARQRAGLTAEAYAELFHAAPVALLTLRAADLVMVEANQPYLDAVGMTSEQVVGRHVFDVFPDSPLNAGQDQATDLADLFQRAITRRERVSVQEMRYDIPTDDGFDVRWWNVSESPVIDDDGRVAYLLHFTEDVTELRRTREELTLAQGAEEVAARQVSSLAEVALALSSAQTLRDLEQVVVSRGLRVLGASGGAVVSRADEGGWRVTATRTLGPELQETYSVLPHDSPFPLAVAAREGARILLSSRAAGLADYPAMAEIYAATDRVAFACLPLVSQGRGLGALQVSWDVEREFTTAELELMEGFAAQCATALDRIEQAEKQRRNAEQLRQLAEALQSSMLTPPPADSGLEVAVRYRTANDVAQVGGDWYDAFVQPDGDLMLVIGDVIGHDDVAAGKMGQVRGLLRALAYDDVKVSESPASVLTRFERVAVGLEVSEISTAILGRVDSEPDSTGGRLFRWTNAGNAPPVLLGPDGSTRLLDVASPDLLLGVEQGIRRTDHVTSIPRGATLLLYTDGLIERRSESIDQGLADLRKALSDLAAAPLEELCDQVLERLDPHIGEDDIALVAVRV